MKKGAIYRLLAVLLYIPTVLLMVAWFFPGLLISSVVWVIYYIYSYIANNSKPGKEFIEALFSIVVFPLIPFSKLKNKGEEIEEIKKKEYDKLQTFRH